MSREYCDNVCVYETNNNADVLFKILIIGDVGVGKSSLLQRFVENAFMNAYSTTIGVDFKTTRLDLGGKFVKLHVWDTAGHERFRSITSAFYRGTHGAVLVYDVTKYNTFKNIDQWLKELSMNTTCHHITKILFGNKSDMSSSRAVPRDTAVRFADSHNMSYFETSAKTGDQVHEAFRNLVSGMLNNMEKGVARKTCETKCCSTTLYLSTEVGNLAAKAPCSC